MLIGYARVSTTDQDTALQLAALRKAGVAPRRIREETASGAGPRVVLEQLLRDLRPGDEVIVYKLDRLARGVRDLLRIVDAIDEAGASFRSITEAIDTGKPAGKLALAMLGAVGEFERDLIKERAAAGFAAARARGVHIGKPRLFNERGEKQIASLFLSGRYTRSELARMHKCSISTMRRILERNGIDPGYMPPMPDDRDAA